MKTLPSKTNDVVRAWHLLDANGQTLGRLSTQIAKLLLGKHKSTYSTNIDSGDFVVVINSDKIKVTGAKLTDKFYYRHSGFPGGFRQISVGEQLLKDSRKVIEHAVSGMIPHNKLHDPRLRRLKTYKGETHPHHSQFSKESK
jgi:large subunit ribosomal protein L13